MSRSILVAVLCTAALAGCGRTVIREERVVEQPVVSRETVVATPTVTRETVVAAPSACALGNGVFTTGTLSCQAGYQYVCRNGAWERIAGSAC